MRLISKILALQATLLLGCAPMAASAAQPSPLTIRVERMPQYPGGEQAMREFVEANLRYPAATGCPAGKVVVQVLVGVDGRVADAQVLRSLTPECDAEALRVASMLQYEPGRANGGEAEFYQEVAINFALTAAAQPQQLQPEPKSQPEVAADHSVPVAQAAELSKPAVQEQPKQAKVSPVGQPQVEETLDQAPRYPDGEQALVTFLRRSLSYPSKARKERAEGRVLVRFTIDERGNVGSVRVLESAHPLLDAEAVRVVRLLPRFSPARHGGEYVKSHMRIPFTFVY